jgi:predicted CXXCH cytochrome family protein
MFHRGVTCSDCHDPHSLKLRAPGYQVCLGCHAKPHRATEDCVACHMPKIATTVADVKVRSHTFAFITPVMSDKYKIPNPCTTCHADKTTAWATETMDRWPERSPWRVH